MKLAAFTTLAKSALRRRTAKALVAGVGILIGMGAARADQLSATTRPASTEPSTAELRQEFNELNAKFEKLEAAQQSTSTASQSGFVKIVSDDEMAANAYTSGYDPSLGFVLRSDDDAFSFHPGAVFDFRYEANFRDDIPKGGGGEAGGIRTDNEDGFNMAKARFTADGNFTKPFTYYVQVEADQGTALTLLDAYGTYHFGDGTWSIRGGQFKDPVWHERNLSEATLMAVDRALVENLVGSGGSLSARVLGAALLYNEERLRAQLVIHHGFDSANQKFYGGGGFGASPIAAAGVTPMDFGVSGRAEYMLLGDITSDYNPYTQYDRGFTSLHARQQSLVAGIGSDFSQAGANDLSLSSADLQYNNRNGLSLYGAYYAAYRDIEVNQGVAPGFYYDQGYELQAGYLLTQKIEPFVRWDVSYLAPGSVGPLIDRQVPELTGGLNYYLYNQNLKITTDFTWLPNGAPEDIDSEGVLQDSGHNEYLFRIQFQLAI